MPSHPSVSIVVPCHNQARYLRAALKSIAHQTRRPLETIVVDDGSTDETTAVAVAHGAAVLRQACGGVSAARNSGLRHARGTFVVFLDADDELEPEAVESGVAALVESPDIWMVARCCVLVDQQGLAMPTNIPDPDTGKLYSEWLHRNDVWTPGAAVFRRAPLAELGGFPVDVGPAADYAVYLELARLGRVIFERRVVVRYRQHDSNMSRDGARMLRATLAVLRRERRHVPPVYRHDFKQGVRDWCTFYGEQIIQQLRADVREGRLGRAQLDDALLVFSECRALAVKHVWRKLRRLAGGHPPSEIEPGRFNALTPSGSRRARSRRRQA